jgi:hypothetical protein
MRIIPILAGAAIAVIAGCSLANAQNTNVAPRSGTAPALMTPNMQSQPYITGSVRKVKKSKKYRYHRVTAR